MLLHCYYILLHIITSFIITYYYSFCYNTVITLLLHIITSFIITLLLHFQLLHCYYTIVTYYYILIITYYYDIIITHYYIIITSLVIHYYTIITSLLHHNSQSQKHVIMISLLHIMHYHCFHYYIVITHYHHYYPLLHVTTGNGATCRWIIDLPQAVQPAERDLDLARRQSARIIDLPQAVQPAERELDRARRKPAGIIDLPQAVQPAEVQPQAAASGREPAVGAYATEILLHSCSS